MSRRRPRMHVLIASGAGRYPGPAAGATRAGSSDRAVLGAVRRDRAGPDAGPVQPCHVAGRADGRMLRPRLLRWPGAVDGLGDRRIHRRLRLPDRAEFHPPVGRRERCPARAHGPVPRCGHEPDPRVLHVDQSARGLAIGRGNGAVHRRIRGVRLCDPARPVCDRAVLVLRARRADHLRRHPGLRETPRRRPDLLGPRPGDLRGPDHVGLPAIATIHRPRFSAADRRVHLP